MSGTSGQSINLSGILKNLKWWQATIMIVSILLAGSLFVHEGGQLSINVDIQARVQAIENRLDIPVNSSLSAFLKSNTFMVSLVDTYATLMNGSNAHLIEFLTNHTQVIDDALRNASIAGGSVYISEGAYSASVTLKDNTRLIIDKGASGITVNGVDASANCILDDFNDGIFQYYKNGLIYCSFDYAHGNLMTQSANLTTIYVQTLTSQSGNLQILKLVVENGTSFPSVTSGGYLFYRSDLSTLYYYNGSGWTGCGGGGGGGPDDDSAYLLSASATNFLLQNGTRPLTANWGTGSFGVYGMSFVNVTSLYCTTIDQLIAGQGVKVLHLIVENGTTFPSSPLDKQVFFRSDLGYLYVYNNSIWTMIGVMPQTYPYANLTGTPDLTVYLLADGTKALTGNWNIGGSYGVYNATWLNTTSISFTGQLWWNGQNRTDIIANPIRYAKYVTYGDGTNYQIQNCTDGQTIYQSTNASNTINFAFGNLTTGRNWKEPVIVLGNYTVDASINVPAYSQPLLYCYIMKTAYNNNSMFVMNGVNDIEIDGGILDGNRANQNIPGMYSTILQQISITNCQRVTVHGVTGLNSGNTFIWMAGDSDCIITQNYSNSTYNDGINVDADCYSNTVSENNFWYCGHVPIVLYSAHDNTITGNVGAYFGQRTTFSGIYVFQGSYRNTFTANVMEYGSGAGAHGLVICGPGSSWGNIIEGNSFINNTSAYGIYIYDANDNTISGNTCANNTDGIVLGINTIGSFSNTVSKNEICGNTHEGILIQASGNNTIYGNSIHGNGRYGIYAITTPVLNWIESNDIEGNANSGIRLEPANMTLIKDNKIVGNGVWGIIVVGATSGNNTIWSNDMGWNASGDISNAGTLTIAFDNFELATRTWVASINPPTSGR